MQAITTGAPLATQLAARAANLADPTYRPEFYRLDAPADRARLEALLDRRPDLQIFDQLAGQLAELIKARRPDHRYGPAELQEALAQHLGGAPLERYGVWVYYP